MFALWRFVTKSLMHSIIPSRKVYRITEIWKYIIEHNKVFTKFSYLGFFVYTYKHSYLVPCRNTLLELSWSWIWSCPTESIVTSKKPEKSISEITISCIKDFVCFPHKFCRLLVNIIEFLACKVKIVNEADGRKGITHALAFKTTRFFLKTITLRIMKKETK